MGALAVQFLRALQPSAWIVALDVHQGRLDKALSLGADEALVVADDAALAQDFAGHGSDLTGVLDFVGTDATLDWAARSVCPPGAIVVCGRGGGELRFSRERVRAGIDLRSSRGGTITDLEHTVGLARDRAVQLCVSVYPHTEVTQAYSDLRAGRLSGRAVLSLTDLGGQ